MDRAFWLQRWRDGELGFHEGRPNDLLAAHFNALSLKTGRVFVPLCGKAVDLHWLREQGFDVCGIDLSRLAIEQLFEEVGAKPEIVDMGALVRFSAPQLEIYFGDIFDLSAGALGTVDAIYDRAALVALPAELRARYAAHLARITNRAPQFLIAFDYDQQSMEGPPFSVPENEIRALYGVDYTLEKLASRPVEGGLKGQCPAEEVVWRLRSKGG